MSTFTTTFENKGYESATAFANLINAAYAEDLDHDLRVNGHRVFNPYKNLRPTAHVFANGTVGIEVELKTPRPDRSNTIYIKVGESATYEDRAV